MAIPLNYNLRNLIVRKGSTLMTAIGIGLTVAVLIVSLSLVEGLKNVFAGSGDPRHALVLRKGVDAELTSTVSSDSYQIIRNMPGIAKNQNKEPLVSPEGLLVINLPSVDSPSGMNVTVRGLLPIGISMRPVQVLQGRMFTPGLRQVVVGEAVARRYPDAQVGKSIRFGKGMWDVVGVFKAGDSAANSEIWADLDQVRGDFERVGGSSSLLVRLDNPAQMEQFKKVIGDNQQLNSQAMSEKQYYANMKTAGVVLEVLGFSVAVIMAVGSAFAATNTMYAAVARRSREIGTLRALGFSRQAILVSFLIESVLLAFLGGLVGVLLALPVNNVTTAVGSFATFSEFAFRLKVGFMAIAFGLGFAVVIGALGGLLPAWSASKKGIIEAMRDI